MAPDVGALSRADQARRPVAGRPAAGRRRRPAAGPDVLLRRRPARRRRQGADPHRRQGPRPRSRPHALARGPRVRGPAVVRRRRRSRGAAGAVGPGAAARPAASWSASPARWPRSFGVCANGDANDDGRVVSFDHGCGAHSEVRLAKQHEPQPLPDPVVRRRSPTTSRPSEPERRVSNISSGLSQRRPGALASAAVLEAQQPEADIRRAQVHSHPAVPGVARVGRRTAAGRGSRRPTARRRPRRCGRRRRRAARRRRRGRCGCRSRAAIGWSSRSSTTQAAPRLVDTVRSAAPGICCGAVSTQTDGRRRAASTASSRSPSAARRSSARSAAASSPSSRWPTSSC